MKNAIIIALALALCFAGCTGNEVKDESAPVAPTEAVSEPAEPPQEKLTQEAVLPSWLVGCWSRGETNAMHETCWREDGEALVGEATTFDMKTKTRSVTDKLRLELRDGAVFYIARPADAEMAREFRLVGQEEDSFIAEAVAEKGEGAALPRLRYEREGDELKVSLSGDEAAELTLIFQRSRQMSGEAARKVVAGVEAQHGITVYSKNGAGRIFVDGEDTGQRTPATVAVDGGSYQVAVQCDGGEALTKAKKIGVKDGQRVKTLFDCASVK